MEVEAKYLAPSYEQLSEFLELDRLGRYNIRTIKEISVVDRYMDTPDLEIWKSGYACRIREKEGKWVLTIKGVGAVQGAVHSREEYEVEIAPGSAPSEWSESLAGKMVLSRIDERRLVEICRIRQQRTLRMVSLDERNVGIMSIDVVDTEVAGSPVRTYELEIELEPDGRIEDLQALDETIRGYGLVPESRSKFERALELLSS